MLNFIKPGILVFEKDTLTTDVKKYEMSSIYRNM